MYITYGEYTALYDNIEEKVFNRLAYDAGRYIDRLTAGADGLKKLKVYPPVDIDNAEAVRRCAAAVVNLLAQIDAAEKNVASGRGYVETENGLRSKVLASLSAGNESVSYATGAAGKSAVDAAVESAAEKEHLVFSVIRHYLSGVEDANGVNLLYMGRYPV